MTDSRYKFGKLFTLYVNSYEFVSKISNSSMWDLDNFWVPIKKVICYLSKSPK